MSPKSFTFKLTVPRDAQVSAIVASVAGHAVSYAGLDTATGTDLVARVAAAVTGVLATAGQPLQIVVTSDATALTFDLEGARVSAPHAS